MQPIRNSSVWKKGQIFADLLLGSPIDIDIYVVKLVN